MKNRYGQVMIEFIFCMLITLIMAYAVIQIFKWSGKELVNQRQKHDTVLKSASGVRAYRDPSQSEQLRQISPTFTTGTPLDAIYKGD